MSLAKSFGLAIGITFLLVLLDFIQLQKRLTQLLSFINSGFVTMLVFMVTKDDYDRYGIWKTFIGTKQPSITEMLEFGKWAVFKPIGLLMQATIIDFNTDDDALESNETMEIASQYASASASLINPAAKTTINQSKTNIPKPPPPPIPPPLPIKTASPSNDGSDFKCKKISWKELKIDMRNTIWDSVNRNLENGEAAVDRKEIVELFREKPRKSRKFSGLSTDTVNSDDILTLTGKKKLNISIALAHHQLFADDLIKAVKNVDVRLLEADFLSTIENFLPDQTEETSLIQKYSSMDLQIDRQVLTDPEEFSFLLASIPQFRKRIRAMVFQCSFFDRVNAICKNFEVVRKSIEEIRQSTKLEKILMYILSAGKAMNNTATKAFNIDFLPTASCCKTSDGNSNFLAYVTSKIESRDPQILKLSEELPSLGKAVKVSLIDVDRDGTELAVEYSSIAMELDSIANDSEGFKDFLQQGKLDLNNIKRKRRQIQQDLNDLAQYFGIDPLKTKPTELFGIFKQFLTDLSNTMETLARKSQQKARSMNRSSSTPNFRRSSRNSSFRGSRNSSTRSSRNSSFRKSSRRSSITSNVSEATCASGESSFTDGIVNGNSASFDIDVEADNTTRPASAGGILMQDSTANALGSASNSPGRTLIQNTNGNATGPASNSAERTFMQRLPNNTKGLSSTSSGCILMQDTNGNAKGPASKSNGHTLMQESPCDGNSKEMGANNTSKSSPQVKRNLNNMLNKMLSEEEDFTSKKEILRKVLLSPVREKPGKSRISREDGTKMSRKEDDGRHKNSNGEIVEGNIEKCVDLEKKEKWKLAKENVIQNGFAHEPGKSGTEYAKLNGEFSGLNGEMSNNKFSASKNEKKQKEIQVSLVRSSSLRRSNRKPKRVSVKSMQAKELQKAKRLLVSKSESNLSSLNLIKHKNKSEAIQSVILKQGFIEKHSPMKCGIKNIEQNNNNYSKSFDDYHSSDTLEKNSTEEKLLRRTKSAIISRNKQKASLVIFV